MDFSRDKDMLLKTLNKYDGGITVEEVTASTFVRPHPKYLHTLFIQALLDQICSSVEPNDHIRKQLFNEVVRRLTELQYLHDGIIIQDLMPVRRYIIDSFLKIVKKIHREIVPNAIDSQITSDVFFKDCDFSTRLLFHTKYKETFEELKVIAKGGFGTVCKAKHKVDGHLYAVKKIIFTYENDSDFLKVIREAKSIAALSHLNVVGYNNAWIECFPLSDLHLQNSSAESSGNDSDDSASAINENPYQYLSMSSTKMRVLSESFVQRINLEDQKEIQCSSKLNSDSPSSNFSTEVSFCSQQSSNHFEENSVSYKENCCEKSNICDTSDDPFESETELLKKFNIKVMLCIQMEYCDYDLRFWLDERAEGKDLPFEMDEIRIFKDILQGLDYIHSKGIIHRDLKPKNIFFSKESHVMKIGDFGLATLAECSADYLDDLEYGRHSSNLGTIPYAAPEQRAGNKYNSKVDIYSLGIILIELLNCFTTYMEMNKAIEEICSGIFPSRMAVKWLEYLPLVKSLVEKQPDDRMSTKEILELQIFQDKENETAILRKAWSEKERELSEWGKVLSEKEKELSGREEILLKRENSLDEREKALFEKEKSLNEQEKALFEKEKSVLETENLLLSRIISFNVSNYSTNSS